MFCLGLLLLYNKIYLISLRRFHASVFSFNFPPCCTLERDRCCCWKMQGKATEDDDDDDANFGLAAVASLL